MSHSEVPIINDKRTETEFKVQTFSGFKKTKVKQQLLSSLIEHIIEESCYWSAELICSGNFIDLWEIIILFTSKYIHIGNPKLPTFISRRMNTFKEILTKSYIDNELNMRNDINIRKLFAQIITILCSSNRQHAFESIKIDPLDFQIIHLSPKLKAKKDTYYKSVFKENDPKELIIPLNELAFNLSENNYNAFTACYWVDWILEYASLCKKDKLKCDIERRSWTNVNEKFQMQPVWIIWDLILFYANQKKSLIITNIISCLLDMFTLRFTPGINKKRKFILYFAISIITKPIDFNIKIWDNTQIIKHVVSKINAVYKQIKSNEQPMPIDYLQLNIKKTNQEKLLRD